MAVTNVTGEGWTITGAGSPLITARPLDPVPGTPARLNLRAANPADTTKTTTLTVECMPVAGVFDRASLSDGGPYTLRYYDKNGAAGLAGPDPAGPDTNPTGPDAANLEEETETEYWLYIPEGDTGTRRLLNAVYSAGETVRSLFNIRFGTTGSADSVEIKGTELPAATGTTVINIGIAGEDNTGLPPFSIPDRTLGTAGETYGHIHFQVNRGAYIIIEADNSAYIANGRGYPCPYGHLTGAAVEVMGGGRLRIGAYEGLPLGKDAVITARLGSYVAVGPESSFDKAADGYVAERDRWYSGWLIGPTASDARIIWGGGDQNGGYIEVREGRLAFDANVMVQKTLALDYSVWFVNGPTLTIDTAGDDLTLDDCRGLFAGSPEFRFYGTTSGSGGQNPSRESAKILVKPGSAISRSFLTDNPEEPDSAEEPMLIATENEVSIKNRGKGSSQPQFPLVSYSGAIQGYCNWDL
jgi:hypothetical protein